jgi:hypothetical protein
VLHDANDPAARVKKGEFCLMPETPHPLEQVNVAALAGKIETFVGKNA